MEETATKLIEMMEYYFKMGKNFNLEKLDALYANDFENVRMDKAGRMVKIGKAAFMERFRMIKAQGLSHGADNDIEILGTSVYDTMGSVLVKRNENNTPALYNFVWRMADGEPKELLREFTVEEDLSGLLEMMKK